MTGHRALEKKQITQGNNRKVQNPGGSLRSMKRGYVKIDITSFYCLYLQACLQRSHVFVNTPIPQVFARLLYNNSGQEEQTQKVWNGHQRIENVGKVPH